MAYQKPIIGALSLESENCGCNFFVDGNGEGFFLYTEGPLLPGGDGSGGVTTPVGPLPTGVPEFRPNPQAVGQNNVASVGDNSASVTPLANTGLPATNPIIIGVPAGVSGVHANVGPVGSGIGANTYAHVDTSGLALTLLGTRYDVPIL
jgi:hypothetical protein